MFQIFSFLLLFLNISNCCCSTVTTPSGIEILVHKVISALPKEKQNNPHLHVYEVDDKGDIRGPNSFKLSIASKPEYEKKLSSHYSFRITLNGQSINYIPLNYKRKSHGKYTAVYGGAHGKLLTLWGPGIYLRPLDRSKTPSVFVNVFREIREEVEEATAEFEFDDDDLFGTPDVNVRLETAAAKDPDCARGLIHYLEVLAVVDNTFCALFGNDITAVTAVLQASIDIANEPFRLQTCIRLVLVGVESHCNDPNDPYKLFKTLDSSQFLFQFAQYFRLNRIGVNRDTAILFSGFSDASDSAIGRAFRPGTCESLGYGWVEGVNPFALSHEIGHNLNMYHTDGGIMSTSSKSREEFYFLEGSVNNLTLYIDHIVSNRYVTCITKEQPTCDSSCPTSCVNNKCIMNKAPGAGRISCIPIAGNVDCATRTPIIDFPGSSYFTKIKCPVGYNFILKTYDPNDPTLVCCLPPTDTTIALGINTQYSYITRDVTRRDGHLYKSVINIAANYSMEKMTFINSIMAPCTRDISGEKHTASPSLTPLLASLPNFSHPIPDSTAPSATYFDSVSPSSSEKPLVLPKLASPILTPSSMTETSSSTKSAPSFEPTTCGEAFTVNRHLTCSTVAHKLIQIGNVGHARIKIRVRSDLFMYVVKGLRGRKLRAFGMIASTSAKLTVNDVEPKMSFFRPRKRLAGIFKTSISNLPLISPKRTCCGRRAVYAYIRISLCNEKKIGCQAGFFPIGLKIKCRSICRKNSNSFTPIPMSDTRVCPLCLRV